MRRTFLIALAAIAFATATSAQNSQYVYFSPPLRRGSRLRPQRPTERQHPAYAPARHGVRLRQRSRRAQLPGSRRRQAGRAQHDPDLALRMLDAAELPAAASDGRGLHGGCQHPAAQPRVRRHGQRRPLQRGGELRGRRRGLGAVPSASRAANLHEMFISAFSDSPGALGYRGTAITEADMMLFPAAPNLYPLPSTPQAPVFFIRQSQLEVFFGMAPGTGAAIDTDGFCVDQSNGDIYISFDGASGTNALPFTGTFRSAPATLTTTTVHAGDIFRIPGNAYTPSGPYGIVTNPQPNLIQRVYTQADVTTMVTTAGGCISNTGSASTGVLYTNSRGLSIDVTAALPTTATPQGFVIKQLFFTIDNRGVTTTGCPGTPSTCQPGVNQNLTSAAIYSTQTGGSFAVINGTIMNQPSAVGMRDCSFNTLFFTGPLDAACVVQLATPYDPVSGGPFHLDNFPDSGYRTTPPPPSPHPVVSPATSRARPPADHRDPGPRGHSDRGLYIDRYSTLAFGILGGYPDLFIDLIGINNPGFLIAPFLLAPYGQNAAAQSFFNGGPAFSTGTRSSRTRTTT